MAKNSEIAVSVKDLHKSFKLPHEQHSGVKQAIINIFRRNRKKGHEVQQVLKGLDFEIEKGDFFGIVGRNGSGKSTLLKTLAGIYTPDKGAVQVNGTLVPFIELGVGFNPELTGRENVFLNGALLGFSRDEMEGMYDDIVEFAELERFMDQKLKNYSSGMQVRLAFSIAIRADGDILLLDEVLAVGDEAFQRKCNDYFKTLKENNKTVILVTHGMDNVRKYCNKAMMVREGKIVSYGSPEDVANEYSMENLTTVEKHDNQEGAEDEKPKLIEDIHVKLLSAKKISQNDQVELSVTYKAKEAVEAKIMLNFVDVNKQVPLYATSTAPEKILKEQIVIKKFKIAVSEINNASIKVTLSIRDKENEILGFPVEENLPTFIVRRTDYRKDQNKKNPYAIMFNRGEWQ